MRRGLPACHVVYGQATAILVGDALLTLAFETLANAPVRRAPVAFRLMGLLTAATGSSHGVIGGQALELEPHPVELEIYHRHKTAALFRAAAAGGAICCGADADVSRWARIGELIGCALQLRDDMEDVGGVDGDIGKPTGRDAALGRPNAALQAGIDSVSAEARRRHRRRARAARPADARERGAAPPGGRGNASRSSPSWLSASVSDGSFSPRGSQVGNGSSCFSWRPASVCSCVTLAMRAFGTCPS